MRATIAIVFLFLSCTVWSQVVLKGIVIDSLDSLPLEFAHVINLRDYTGTITNTNGEFAMECYKEDSIKFQFIGYKDLVIAVRDISVDGIVKLAVDAELVDQVTILSDDSYLYDLVVACRKNLDATELEESNAKAYLNILSNSKGAPLEFIEAFYNAELDKGAIKKIQYKNGKSFLSRHQYGGYFFNINISKALTMYSLLSGHPVFPTNPLELSRRKLYKRYKLSLQSRTKDMVVIAFEPRKDFENFFSGTLWMNPKNYNIKKIELVSNGKGKGTFRGIGRSRIQEISYKLDFSFLTKKKGPLLQYVKLDYSTVLATALDPNKLLEVSAESILHLFDYDSQYILPYISYHQGLSDYSLFSMLPPHEGIWKVLESDNQIKLSDEKRLIEHQMQDKGTAYSSELTEGKPFFERSFATWSDTTRVILKLKPRNIDNGMFLSTEPFVRIQIS